MGYVGIILALAIFIVLVYKGWKNYYVAPICVIIVSVFNEMNPIEQLNGNYITGVLDMCKIVFVILFLGTIFGRIYADTGASQSIAKFLIVHFVDRVGGKYRILVAIICYYILVGLMMIGGIDSYAIFFTTVPICAIFCKKCGIPRRFIPGLLYVMSGLAAAPGVPGIYNIMPQTAMATMGIEWSTTSCLVPGVIAAVVCAVLCIFTLNKMVKKAVANGETFEYGELEHYDLDDNRKLPNVIVAIIPLVVVFILFSVCKMDILIAESAGILLALILMGRYMEGTSTFKGFLGTLKSTLNMGVGGFPDAMLSVSIASGLATVITATAAFSAIVAAFAGLNMHPLFLTIIVVCVIVGITSSPPVAMLVGIPMVVGILQQNGVAFDASAIGRVGSYAALTFESLPISGAILLTLSLSKVSHKEGYFPEFIESVVWTTLVTILCAVLCIVFPGLA